MLEYGTKEYWEGELRIAEARKTFFEAGFKEVVGRVGIDDELMEDAYRIFCDLNRDIEYAKGKLKDVESVQ